MRRVPLRTLAVAAVLCTAMAARAQAWPEVRLPEGAAAEIVAPDMVLNGARSRVLRFHTGQTEAEVLDFYRRQFGAERVENTVRGLRVIATKTGEHFVTVQLRPAGPHAVEGTVMTTLLQGGPVRSAVASDTEKVLPADSHVLSRMQSDDAGQRAVLVTAANANSLQVNRDHVLKGLQDRGFRLVREDAAAVQGHASISLVLVSGSEEASVSIADAGRYRSVVIQRTKEPK